MSDMEILTITIGCNIQPMAYLTCRFGNDSLNCVLIEITYEKETLIQTYMNANCIHSVATASASLTNLSSNYEFSQNDISLIDYIGKVSVGVNKVVDELNRAKQKMD